MNKPGYEAAVPYCHINPFFLFQCGCKQLDVCTTSSVLGLLHVYIQISEGWEFISRMIKKLLHMRGGLNHSRFLL